MNLEQKTEKPTICKFYHRVTEDGKEREKCKYWGGMCVGDNAKKIEEDCPFYIISLKYHDYNDWIEEVRKKLG